MRLRLPRRLAPTGIHLQGFSLELSDNEVCLPLQSGSKPTAAVAMPNASAMMDQNRYS